MSKITLVIVLLAIIATGMYVNSTGFTDSKPALKLVITTGIGNDDTVKVTNITFEQTTVPFYFARRDAPTAFPEINVFVKSNDEQATTMSYWAAVNRPNNEGEYPMTITFRDGKEPKINDTLILAVKLTDFKGNQIYKTTAFYGWE